MDQGTARDNSGYRGVSHDLALTSGEGSEQQRPWERAVYGMQEVRRQLGRGGHSTSRRIASAPPPD
jgi:hypothetical protein